MNILTGINSFFGRAIQHVFAMLSLAGVWPALIVISVVVGAFALVVFKYLTNQERLSRAKQRLFARVLEILFFRDSPIDVFRSFGRILRATGVYILRTIPAFVCLLVPVVVVMVNMSGWFGLRALRPGETAVLRVILNENSSLNDRELSAQGEGGVLIETEPLRIPSENEYDWRLRADSEGVHSVRVRVGSGSIEKDIVVSDALVGVSERRVTGWRALGYPVEDPIPGSMGIREVIVNYPARSLRVAGMNFNWVIAFFVLTLVAGLLLKKPLKTDF